MEILFTGKPLKVSKKIVREAVEFYGPVLMTSRMLDTLQLNINFKGDMVDLAETEGTYDDAFATPRMFDIDIANNMGLRRTLISLAHEMVHVKQFATGEMKDRERPYGLTQFRKQLYSATAEDFNKYSQEYFDYLDKPWEIEAYGREYALYIRFMHHYWKQKRKMKAT